MSLTRKNKHSEQAYIETDALTFLEALPDDVLLRIIKLIETESKAKALGTILAVRAASKKNSLFTTDTHFTQIAGKALAEIVEPVIASNVKKVDELITQCPRLLFVPIPSITITRNNTTQTYKDYTLLQLARAEGDELLFAVLESHLMSACGSEAARKSEIEKQLNEKFSGEALQKDNIKKFIEALLDPLIAAIKLEKFTRYEDNKWILSDDTHKAIKTFRDGFMALMQNEITHGMRFDIEILYKIFEVYAREDSKLSHEQCLLFEAAAISFVLRYSPSTDAQKFAQGLYYLQKEHDPEPFKATIVLRKKLNNFFDVLGRPSLYFAGLDGICVDIVFAGEWGAVGCVWWLAIAKTYFEQKLQFGRTYAATPETDSVLRDSMKCN